MITRQGTIPPLACVRDETVTLIPGEEQQRKDALINKKSFHPILRGTHEKAPYLFKVPAMDSFTLDEKKHEWGAPALEACNAFLFRLLHPTLAPETNLFYNKEGTVLFVGSKLIPNFKTNRESPLTTDRFLIGCLDAETIACRKLHQSLKDYSHFLKTKNTVEEQTSSPALSQSQSYTSWFYNGLSSGVRKVSSTVGSTLSSGKNYTVSWINSYNSSNTAAQIDKFIAEKNNFSHEEIGNILLPLLQGRGSNISPLGDKEHIDELKDKLNPLIDEITKLSSKLKGSLSKSGLHDSKKDFFRSKSGVVLTPELILKFETLLDNFGASLYTGSYKDNDILDEKHNISVKDLKNYRTLRDVTTFTAKSHYDYELDFHNENSCTVQGLESRIDFDFMKKVSIHFKDPGLIERFFRKPTPKSFCYNSDVFNNFPVIDTDLFYWPTKETILDKSTAAAFELVYQNIAKHFYAPTDNKVFQSLATDPVAQFHKYRTWLELILMPEKLIADSCEGIIRDNIQYKDIDTHEYKYLLDEIKKSELERQKELRVAAINDPGFENFLKVYGDCAFSITKKTYQDTMTRLKIEAISKNVPYLEKLANHINLEQIENEYQTFCQIVKAPSKNWEIEDGELKLDETMIPTSSSRNSFWASAGTSTGSPKLSESLPQPKPEVDTRRLSQSQPAFHH